MAHTPAEQTAAHVTVSSISQGSAGLSTLLRIPPAAARSFGDDASTPAACTPVPDVEAQLGNHSQSDMQAECRICLSAGSAGHDLFQPCACAGTMGYTHAACLAAWVQEKGSLTCELCKQCYKEPYVQALGFCIRASWSSSTCMLRSRRRSSSNTLAQAWVRVRRRAKQPLRPAPAMAACSA